MKRRRCCESQRAKAGGWESLAHSRWSGARRYLRRGNLRGGERVENFGTHISSRSNGIFFASGGRSRIACACV